MSLLHKLALLLGHQVGSSQEEPSLLHPHLVPMGHFPIGDLPSQVPLEFDGKTTYMSLLKNMYTRKSVYLRRENDDKRKQ